MPYQSTINYEGQTYVVDVPDLVVPRCKTCGELYFDNYADDQINRYFRVQAHLLTPEQIRDNRTALGLGQEEFAARVGVEVDLLRRWEEDISIQSRVQDNLLRLYFALPQVRSALSSVASGLELGAAVGY
jgi:DNA-binding transcriptional regulator YiaG